MACLEASSVAGDVVVVARESDSVHVIGDERRDGVRTVLAGRTAMNDD